MLVTNIIDLNAMSVLPRLCLSPSPAIFFKASHWPLDHMISSMPLIGQPSLLTMWWWGWGGAQWAISTA